jgi:hypothetical protein
VGDSNHGELKARTWHEVSINDSWISHDRTLALSVRLDDEA